MLIRTHNAGFDHANSSDITPQHLYLSRRDLLKWGAAGGSVLASGATWAQSAKADSLKALSSVKSTVPGALTTIGSNDTADEGCFAHHHWLFSVGAAEAGVLTMQRDQFVGNDLKLIGAGTIPFLLARHFFCQTW